MWIAQCLNETFCLDCLDDDVLSAWEVWCSNASYMMHRYYWIYEHGMDRNVSCLQRIACTALDWTGFNWLWLNAHMHLCCDWSLMTVAKDCVSLWTPTGYATSLIHTYKLTTASYEYWRLNFRWLEAHSDFLSVYSDEGHSIVVETSVKDLLWS